MILVVAKLVYSTHSTQVKHLFKFLQFKFQGNILRMHPNYEEGGKNPFDKQYDNVIEGTVVQVQVQDSLTQDKRV